MSARLPALPALTGIRFFAALAVLVSHFTHLGLVGVPLGLIDVLAGGKTAVSLFFVLSGFVLAYNYHHLEGADDRRKYYISRVARIYPVVILALGIGAFGVVFAWFNRGEGYLLSWYSLDSHEGILLGLSFVAQATMTTGWLPAASLNQPWNGPAWSISCEIFFYALFPLLIALSRKLPTRRILVLTASTFAFQIVLIALIRLAAPIGQRGFLVSQFPPTHLFEFVAGLTAGIVFLRGGKEWMEIGMRRSGMLWSSTAVIVALSIIQPIDPAFLPLTPFFAVFVFALAAPTKGPSLLRSRPVTLLGEASFSLYMTHIPIANLLTLADPPPLAGWLLLVATIGLSVVIFKYYETPARNLVRRWGDERRPRVRAIPTSAPDQHGKDWRHFQQAFLVVVSCFTAAALLFAMLADYVLNRPGIFEFRVQALLGVLSGTTAGQSLSSRNEQYTYAAEMIAQSPWFGWGLDPPLVTIVKRGVIGVIFLVAFVTMPSMPPLSMMNALHTRQRDGELLH